MGAHPVLEVFANLWPVFEAVSIKMKTSHLVIEKLCRCYKHAMRSCRKHFEPMLDRMTALDKIAAGRLMEIQFPPLCKTARGIRPRLLVILRLLLLDLHHGSST